MKTREIKEWLAAEEEKAYLAIIRAAEVQESEKAAEGSKSSVKSK